MTDPHHRPPKPPKPGISSSNASVVPIGFALNIEQSDKVIEQTAELNQNIRPLGIDLKMAKSNVTVYFGSVVASINITPSITLTIGTDQGISAVAKDSLGVPISGRPITAVSTNTSVCTVISTSGTSAAFSITLHPLSAGNCQINVTCDGVIGICNVTVSAIIVVGAPYFADRFTGGVRHSANGYGYEAATPSVCYISPLNPYPGDTHSLHMKFVAAGGYAEQRGFFGQILTEFYIGWYHYIPNGLESTGSADYFHRNGPSSDNNKWIRIWDNWSSGNSGCSYTNQRLKVGASTRPRPSTGGPESTLETNGEIGIFGMRPGISSQTVTSCSLSHAGEVHSGIYNAGTTDQSTFPTQFPSSYLSNADLNPYGPQDWITAADHGHWFKFVGHIKMETADDANDGAVQWYKNDILKYSHTKVNLRDYDHLATGFKFFYLLGAANSGWNADIVQQIARFRIGPTYASADPASTTDWIGG